MRQTPSCQNPDAACVCSLTSPPVNSQIKRSSGYTAQVGRRSCSVLYQWAAAFWDRWLPLCLLLGRSICISYICKCLGPEQMKPSLRWLLRRTELPSDIFMSWELLGLSALCSSVPVSVWLWGTPSCVCPRLPEGAGLQDGQFGQKWMREKTEPQSIWCGCESGERLRTALWVLVYICMCHSHRENTVWCLCF